MDIATIRNKNLDCFEIAVATAAKSVNRDCFFMFADSWRFRYTTTGNTFGERLCTNLNRKMTELLHIYHGISLKRIAFREFMDCDQSACMQKKYVEPFIIVIDSYYISLIREREQIDQHLEHYLIANQYDDKNQIMTLYSPYYDCMINISIKLLTEINYGVYKLQMGNFMLFDQIDWTLLFKRYSLDRFILYDNNEMEEFIIDLESGISLTDEMGDHELHEIPLMSEIKFIRMGISNYIDFLNQIKNTCQIIDLSMSIENLKHILWLWDRVMSQFVKRFFQSKMCREIKKEYIVNIISTVKEIRDLENKVAHDILYSLR